MSLRLCPDNFLYTFAIKRLQPKFSQHKQINKQYQKISKQLIFNFFQFFVYIALMEQASKKFQQGSIGQAIEIYTQIIQAKQERWTEALLNRASARYTQTQFQLSKSDAKQYLVRANEPKIEGYLLLANNLIKLKAQTTNEEKERLEQGRLRFSYHKKYMETLKIIAELQVTENEDQFLDRVFQKLLSEPKIRNFMQEEAFLTKIEKLIKNPSLACSLIKMDPRLADVQQIILMAEQ